MLQFLHINPLIKESSPTASPERKSFSRHHKSTETFYKMIYKELTGGQGEYTVISLVVNELRVHRAALLLKQTKEQPFSYIWYFPD